MSSSCEMCGRNGTRCTSRAYVWPTVSGWSRPTHKNNTKSTFFLSALTFLSSTLRNVWQEWDAVHIARARLANPKRVVAPYPSKHNTKSTLFSSTLTFLSSPLRNAQQEWDAAHIARGRLPIPKRDLASYLSKNKCKANVLVNIDFPVVDAAKCAAGMGRGAHRVLYVKPPTM